MDWRKAVVHTTGTVDEELLLRREYLSTENRILIQQLQGRLSLTDPQSQTRAGTWLATVVVRAAAFVWKLARMDILTVRVVIKRLV